MARKPPKKQGFFSGNHQKSKAFFSPLNPKLPGKGGEENDQVVAGDSLQKQKREAESKEKKIRVGKGVV